MSVVDTYHVSTKVSAMTASCSSEGSGVGQNYTLRMWYHTGQMNII